MRASLVVFGAAVAAGAVGATYATVVPPEYRAQASFHVDARVAVAPSDDVHIVPDTRVVVVAASRPTAADAATAANAKADQLVERLVTAATKDIDQELAALDGEVARQGETSAATERLVLDQRVTAREQRPRLRPAVSTHNQLDWVRRQLADLRLLETDPASVAIVARDPVRRRLADHVRALEGERAVLSLRYGASHPNIRRLDDRIRVVRVQGEQATERVVAQLRQQREYLLSEEQLLARQVEGIRAQGERADAAGRRLGELVRQLERERRAYDTLAARQRALRVARVLATPRITAIGRAVPPAGPEPRPFVDWAYRLTGTLLVGWVLTLVWPANGRTAEWTAPAAPLFGTQSWPPRVELEPAAMRAELPPTSLPVEMPAAARPVVEPQAPSEPGHRWSDAA